MEPPELCLGEQLYTEAAECYMLGGKKNPLICFCICKQLSQSLTGAEHEQVKLIEVPGDSKSIYEASNDLQLH